MTTKAVFHINEERETTWTDLLTNVTNFLNQVSEEKAEICVVAHGRAIEHFRKEHTPDNSAWIERLADRGVSFRLCRNSLDAYGIAPDDLLEVCRIVPSGVVELADLQHDGYAYLKP